MAARTSRGGTRRWLARVAIGLGSLLALVVVIVVVLALVPAGTGGLGADPSSESTVAGARARFDTALSQEGSVRPECRSRLYAGEKRSARVVVLFHGLTNCPRQMVELAEQLRADGAAVIVLRAPDHGLRGDVGKIGGVDAEDFRDYADEAVDIAAGLGDEVTVMGLSLGGALTAWAAEERPEVDRAVVIAPALAVGGVPGFVADGFTNVFSRLPNMKLPSGGVALPHAYAPPIATHPTAEMFRLSKYVLEQAADGAPDGTLAVVLNDNDHTISNDRAERLIARWRESGAQVTVVRIPKSLGLPHDVVDVAQPKQDSAGLYPVFVAHAAGRRPPALPASRTVG